MNNYLSAACSNYDRLYEVVKKSFHKEKIHLYGPCVGLLLGKNTMMDEEGFKKSWQYIKKESGGVYSTIREAAKIGLTAMISDSPNPEKRAADFRTAFEILQERFSNTLVLPISAMMLSEIAEEEEFASLADTAVTIHDDMYFTRPICTTEDEIVLSFLLAKKGYTKETFHSEIDRYLKYLKGTFKVNAGTQNAAIVLMLLPGEMEAKCKKFEDLYLAMKAKGVKYSVERDLACLASLVCYSESAEQIAADILEADAFLEKRKEYGLLGCDRRNRIMHAVLITEAAYRRAAEDKNPEVAQIVENINRENKEKLIAHLQEKKLEEARAKMRPGDTLELEEITEEDLGFVEDLVYHPPISELTAALIAEQVAVRLATSNKVGGVSSYAMLLGKKR